jgi:hypothetical protein
MLSMKETLLRDLREPDARAAVTAAVVALFDRWNLGERDRAILVGLSEASQGALDEALRRGRGSMECMGELLAIGRALDVKFRHHAELRDHWIATYPMELGGRRPLDIMLRGGLPGMREVRALLQSGQEKQRERPV